MDIPEDVLEKLKCSRCNTYLSVGPVYIQYDGTAVCNCCHAEDEKSIRNLQYEATARLLLFPCKNRNLGCDYTYPFVENKEDLTNHEFTCEYQQYACPLLHSDSCDWSGTKAEMLEHCQENHPTQVLDNSCSFDVEVTKSSVKNYLLTAFEFLFVLHMKVCMTSGKIFHSVRFLGSSDEASSFNYIVGIHRNKETLLKIGDVTSHDYSVIKDSASQFLNINSLLDVLGGRDKTVIIVTIENNSEICVKCGLQKSLIYCDEKGLQCKQCASNEVKCKYCIFKDFKGKIRKHELNFCNLRNTCAVCDSKLTNIKLPEHYKSECSILKYKSSFGRITLNKSEKYNNYYFCSITGPVICWYRRINTEFALEIHSSIDGEDLHKYSCEVRLSESSTGFIRIFKPVVSYTTDYDWIITVNNEDIPTDCQYFNVYINISKK